MHSLPPPPPPPPPHPSPLQTQKPTPKPDPLNQIVISEQDMNQQNPAPNLPNHKAMMGKRATILRQPHPRRTNPVIWCGAIMCLIFSLLLIFCGVATLIIFLAVKPRNPFFDASNASLNSIYFDSPEYFNGDFTFLANFSNPNRKIDVRFEYLDVELYFKDRLIGAQGIKPFTQRPGETKLESVHLISSLVYLPQNLAAELHKQLQTARVNYNIRGTFKVKANLGLLHFSYWLHGRCQLQMTDPPVGVLVAHRCVTHR